MMSEASGKQFGRDEISKYFRETSDLFNSFVMVAPLLVLYEFGLYFIDFSRINGVDFFSFMLLKLGKNIFLIVNLLVVVFFIVSLIYLGHKKRFHVNYFFVAIAESTVYAILMWVLIVLSLRILNINPGLTGPFMTISMTSKVFAVNLIISFGAGVYEEIFFRLFMFGGLLYLLTKYFNADKGLSFLIACVSSSILFSIAHFFAFWPDSSMQFIFEFLYRFLAGVVLVVIYYFRSFAIAVYSHALYNIFVLTFGGV